MDGQLAVCGRGDISIKTILDRIALRTCFIAHRFRLDEMARAIPDFDSSCSATTPESLNYRDSIRYCSEDQSTIHHDRDSFRHHPRLSLREKSALPVLRIHCLVDPFFVVERRNSSRSHLYHLGGAGMGVERLSQHDDQLRCGRDMLGHHHHRLIPGS